MSNMSQQTIQTKEMPAAVNPNGTHSTGPIGFQSGVSANITAILELIEALNQIQSMKNELFCKEATAESHLTTAYADGQRALGQQQYTEMLSSALGSILCGVGQLGLSGLGMYQDKALSPMQDEINGASNFKFEQKTASNLDETAGQTPKPVETKEAEGLVIEPETTETVAPRKTLTEEEQKAYNEKAEKLLAKIKSGEFRLASETNKGQVATVTTEDQETIDNISSDKVDELNKAVEDRLSELKETYRGAQNKKSEFLTTLSNLGQGINGISSGTGGAVAAQQKAVQGKQEADNTQFNSTMQQFSKLAEESQKQADDDTRTAQELTQTIVGFSKADSAILSA